MIALALGLALFVAQALPFAPSQKNPAADSSPQSPADPAAESAPQNQETIAVRPSNAKGPSLWTRAKHAVENTVSRLWEKDEPHATEGNLATINGDVDPALKHYDEAEKHIAPGSDAAATLAFDRSAAMLKGPPEMGKDALEQARKAREEGSPGIRAKAAYNEGVALEAQDKPDEAIKAYANALSLDPNDVDSKVNLELLLKEHQKKQPSAGQQQDDKQKQPQQDKDKQQQQQAKGKEDQKKDDKDQQKKEGDDQQKKDQQAQSKSDEKKEAKPDEKKDQQAEQQKGDEQQDQSGEKPKDEQQQQASMGRSEAQRLLDAAKAGEKNLQMWRFGKQAEQHKPRSAAEKDW